MAKFKPEFKLVSYGLYTPWEARSKKMPELLQFTTDIPAELDVEFGLIVNIKRAKGKKIQCCIAHPDIPDDDGKVMPPFVDEVYVRKNNWDFFLGDTLWAPVENKRGEWHLSIELEGSVIAKKRFKVD